MNAVAEGAHSLLFVPASRTDRYDRAIQSGAGAVILDLEDSVARSQKAAARAEVAAWLGGASRGSVVVRINAVDTTWHDQDLEMVAAAGCSVMLPKADSVDVARTIRSKLDPVASLIALVETARGLRNLTPLCQSGAVDRIAFGSIDFALDIGADLSRGDGGLAAARSAMVLESRLAGLPAPIDGVTTALRAPATLNAEIDQALAFGFGGKLAIHPEQVPAINGAWMPSAEQTAWAERVVTAAGGDGSLADGVLVIDGEMIDQPILARAQRLLASVLSTPEGTS